jgi:TIR domain/Predicted nucleotide-binding protein containing TIR-like domain
MIFTKPSVFVSCPTDGLEIAREIGRQLEVSATVTIWPDHVFRPGKLTIESLTEVADRSDLAVFILTPDTATKHNNTFSLPRYNDVFELGFLAGRLGISRTLIVTAGPGDIELPSDLYGVLWFRIPPRDTRYLPELVATIASAIKKILSEVGVREERSIAYSSCFISYSWNDKDFAAKLHDDLQQVGIRCWLDSRDMQAGREIQEQIDRAIQAHDKVLLVLSQSSIRSSWVRLEIKNALQLETARNKTVLFPMRLDDSVFAVDGIKEIDGIKNKFIIDFRDWQDKARYQQAFSQLVRDLAINASVELGSTDDA